MPDTERTEPATPHRRQEARLKGQVAKSIEVNSAFVLITGFLILRYLSGYMFGHLQMIMHSSFVNIGKITFTLDSLFRYSGLFFFRLALLILPFILIITLAAIVANLLQVGFLHSWQIIRPQISRINPVQGLKRFLSYRAFVELFKSFLKIGITAAVAYFFIKGEINRIMFTADMTPPQSLNIAVTLIFRLGLRIGLVLGALALADYLYMRWEYERSLRMTRQELKEELIRYEGRPEVKARVRAMQRQLAMRRMMQEVPKADVVITNPVTLAVALRYEPKEMVAPKVVAKGARLIAEKIIEIAREHNIPIVENKPLAQMLFKLVEIGEMIPLALYQAVAEVLAYIWRTGKLKRKWF